MDRGFPIEWMNALFHNHRLLTSQSHSRRTPSAGAGHSISIEGPVTSGLLTVHRLEKFLVGFGPLDLVHQEFHRLHGAQRTEDFAEDPHLIQTILVYQQLFFSRPGLTDVDRR